MSNAFKCPIEGTLHEGQGPRVVQAKLDAKRMVEVRVFEREAGTDENPRYADRMLSPAAVAKIEAAVQVLAPKGKAS